MPLSATTSTNLQILMQLEFTKVSHMTHGHNIAHGAYNLTYFYIIL